MAICPLSTTNYQLKVVPLCPILSSIKSQIIIEHETKDETVA